MKIRNDFVSNSSSCSFILSSDHKCLPDAITLLDKALNIDDIPYSVGENIRITCTVKQKWFKSVYKEITGEAYDKYGVNDLSYYKEIFWDDSIEITFTKLIELAKSDIFSKISKIRFQCEDSDDIGCFYLSLLYLFFERNGMCPDASDSEHSFVEHMDENSFIVKLATYGKE